MTAPDRLRTDLATRDRLAAVVSAELVELLEALVDERVAEALAAAAGSANDSPWLSVLDAAHYLGLSERTMERAIAKGRVRSTAVGRRRLLHRDDLDALVKATSGEEIAPTTPPRRRGE